MKEKGILLSLPC